MYGGTGEAVLLATEGTREEVDIFLHYTPASTVGGFAVEAKRKWTTWPTDSLKSETDKKNFILKKIKISNSKEKISL